MPGPASAGRPPAAALALAAFGGFLLGVLGSFLRAVEMRSLPVGTVLVLAATGVGFFGARTACRSRAGAAACAAGWGFAVITLITPRAAGDIVLTGEPETYVFLVGGLVLAAVASAWPYGLPRLGDPVEARGVPHGDDR